MRIQDVDKNFAVGNTAAPNGTIWLSPLEKPFRIDGLYLSEPGCPYRRMPKNIADQVNEGVAWLSTHTAGGRIRFTTDASCIWLKVKMPETPTMAHITFLGQSGFDLYRSNDGKYTFAGSFFPGERNHGYEAHLDLDGELHSYTIYMPLYDAVEEIYIGLPSVARLDEPEEYTTPGNVLYYGSSITQGGCASRPGNSYQAMISRRFDMDFTNLGFSGSARAENVMVNYLASLQTDIFVCDYDHNTPNPEHLRSTHLPLYLAYREAHPETPIVLVTKPDFTPGKAEEEERRHIILDTYIYALNHGDQNILFVDGARLFDGDFRDSCTVDGCHPNDLGFYRMAKHIGGAIGEILNRKKNLVK